MNYFTKIFSTGAIRKSPKKVINYISDSIDTNKKNTIVEFGAGKGEITKYVIQKNQSAILEYYAFELDRDLGKSLQSEVPQIQVLFENAFDFEKILHEKISVDYFICSIPLSFYSQKNIRTLIEKMQLRLNNDGKIIIIFNAFWLLFFFKNMKSLIKTKIFSTFPVYFLTILKK